MKICKSCNILKEFNEFNRASDNKDGLQSKCRKCARTIARKWYKENSARCRESSRIWKENNLERVKDNTKEWRLKNHDRYRDNLTKYERERCRRDPAFKLSRLLRQRLRSILNGQKKLGSFVRDLGCSVDMLKTYLEGKFQPGMSWDNHGIYGWHIDHIKPLSSFDLTNREEFLRAVHYTNLQPLWAIDNLKKSDKVS